MSDHPQRFVAEPGAAPLVQLKGIAKYFPGVIANEDVDLDVLPGEIHALLGENGAGKSTLMNILTGIYQPDAGEIIIEGYRRDFSSPQQAIAAGIGMVHQHFKLVQAFTVAENIHLGWKDTPRLASASVLEARTAKLATKFNLQVRPAARITELSTGEQQRVEILRVLAREARKRQPKLKVLLTTGYSDAAVERADANIGEFEIINKPYRRTDLVRRVRQLLDGPTGVT